MLKEKFTFITITETHLNPERDELLEIPGYKSENFYRSAGQGGGIKFYYLDHISVIRSNDLITDSCENIIIKASIPGYNRTIVICNIYRPPQNPYPPFYSFLENVINLASCQDLVILGDININTLDSQSTNASYYENLLESYGLRNEITVPTHVNPSTNEDGSCLDHIVHNMVQKSESFVLSPNISDHYSVVTVFHQSIENKPIKINFRDFSATNIAKFHARLNAEFANYHPPLSDSESHCSYAVNFLTKLQNKYFPLKQKIISQKRLNAPWITKNVRKCVRKKHRWFRMAKEGIITFESYKSFSKSLKKLLCLAKTEYYSRRFNSLRKNNQKNWQTLNKLLGKSTKTISDRFNIDGILSTDPKKIAAEFNKFFINHPLSIQRNVRRPSTDFTNLVAFNRNCANLDACSANEISLEISSMKNSNRNDDISSKFLKLCIVPVSNILSDLFNQCMMEGVFPDALKIAKVTPVFKKGAKTEISNHRPISVLSNISKLFESVIYKRIVCFFETNGLLNSDQFGFRKQRNTEQAIFTLLERIIPAFEKCAFSVCVFLDFSACFDIVDRKILLEKLYRYGIRGRFHSLISSYFQSRKQLVTFRGNKSYVAEQTLGVVQGSKCGPLYYDIYSCDLSKICFDDEFIMFADDTCLTYYGDNLSDLLNHVNQRLSLIYEWCCHNKLSLNPNKCKYMIFTNKPYDINALPPLALDNECLENVSSFKYLGITLDSKLKYDEHIKSLCNNLSRMCGITFRLKRHFDLQSAKNLYFACIYAFLTYCIGVWGGVIQCTTKTERLNNLHIRAVNNLFAELCPPNTNIFKHLKLLTLNDIHRLYAAMQMFKVVRLNQCPTVQMNLNLTYPEHNHDTRSRHNAILPFPRVEAIRSNYVYQCIQVWNTIPEPIRNKTSISVFKRSLMKYFIDRY